MSTQEANKGSAEGTAPSSKSEAESDAGSENDGPAAPITLVEQL